MVLSFKLWAMAYHSYPVFGIFPTLCMQDSEHRWLVYNMTIDVILYTGHVCSLLKCYFFVTSLPRYRVFFLFIVCTESKGFKYKS